MPSRKPFAALPMVGEAWQFFRKQPALLPVSVLMLGVPNFLISTLGRLIEPGGLFINSQPAVFLQAYDNMRFSVGLGGFLLFLLTLWGMGSVLTVGRRMIGARSGRARTSFTSVAEEASVYTRTMFFTAILVAAEVLVWSALGLVATYLLMMAFPALFPLFSGRQISLALFLQLPAGVAAVRLCLALLAVVCEEPLAYRKAMRRSKDLIRGHFWRTIWWLCVHLALLVLPLAVCSSLLEAYVVTPWMLLAGDCAIQLATGLVVTILLLSMTLLYGALRDAPREVKM